MATAVGRLGHEDRASVVDHLQELRTRLIVSLAAVAVAFGFCMWQNHALLKIINAPLSHETQKQVRKGNGPLGSTYTLQESTRVLAVQELALASALQQPHSGASAATRRALAQSSPALRATLKRLSAAPQGNKPVTLGIGEPFTTTIGISLLFALILSLPIVLYELYGFLLPAFSPKQRGVATPLLLAIPFLFACGVTFGYFVVLPAAVRFFQNFNSGQFNVLVQANQYYHFAAVTLLAMGLVFQIPVAILAATRAGVVTTHQLRHNRRYAVLACGAVAAFLPGDAITLLLETVPLYLLFELSVLLARVFEFRASRREATDVA
ncbi:MAG TPA: twin-arginine translocase subunit TatC [Solirubrobacteraceae bacterium]|jgi:sec-independent protein translocase protein TatC|nr:twin-arginine translocase subunit TatC [Solirubrobacteraceae bacterium]